jgi:hypothetical protein
MINENKISNNYAQNSFRNKKEYRKFEKISDRHRNCHEKMNFRKSERKRRKRIKYFKLKYADD